MTANAHTSFDNDGALSAAIERQSANVEEFDSNLDACIDKPRFEISAELQKLTGNLAENIPAGPSS